MKQNRCVLSTLSVLVLVFSLFFLPVQADLFVGTGSGSQGFVEDKRGPDASNPFSNRSWPQVMWETPSRTWSGYK